METAKIAVDSCYVLRGKFEAWYIYIPNCFHFCWDLLKGLKSGIYGVPSPPKINFLFSTLLYIFDTTFLIATQLFVFNTTFYFQHNFLFSTQLFNFNTTFYFQHNFLFSTQLFIFNTTFYFQHNFFYPTAIHSCHVSRARTFFEKSCKNVVKL